MNNFNIFKRMFNNEVGGRGNQRRGSPNGNGNYGANGGGHESEFEDLYQDVDSNYNYIEY